MAADLSPPNPAPIASSVDSCSSPKSNVTVFPSPWAQVVRGEPETSQTTISSGSNGPCSPSQSMTPPPRPHSEPADVAEGETDGSNGNADVSKKSVWSKPSLNVVVEDGLVLGASWPSISESARAPRKSLSRSPKPDSDGPISVPQGPVIANAPQKTINTNGNPNFTPNHTQRPRSAKRGGSARGGSRQSGFSRPLAPPPPPSPLPPPFPVPYGNLMPPVMELPIREPVYAYKGNNMEIRPTEGVGSHSHNGNDSSSQRHSSRKGSFGFRPRGDGVYHNGYGGRRGQDWDRNASRNSTARDVHTRPMGPPPPPPRAMMRPIIPGFAPFIPSQHLRPFGNPMPFDMSPPFFYGPPLPPETLSSVPLVPYPLPPSMFFHPNVRALLVKQIDYYFSDDNLVKDNYLRSNMDDEGWVDISLIASFPRVLKLTNNVQLILDTLGDSTIVEVQDDKVRKREDWKKWIPSSGLVPPDSSLLSPSESTDTMLATSIENVSLDEVATNQTSTMDTKDAQSSGPMIAE